MSSSAESTTTTAVAAALAVEDLEVAYTVRGIDRAVLRGVSFTVAPGETFGLVGESGCGKSTLARMVSLIEHPTAGELRLGGVDVVTAQPQQRKALRRAVQLVFQNPYGSLNPRKKIGAILEAPWRSTPS